MPGQRLSALFLEQSRVGGLDAFFLSVLLLFPFFFILGTLVSHRTLLFYRYPSVCTANKKINRLNIAQNF